MTFLFVVFLFCVCMLFVVVVVLCVCVYLFIFYYLFCFYLGKKERDKMGKTLCELVRKIKENSKNRTSENLDFSCLTA